MMNSVWDLEAVQRRWLTIPAVHTLGYRLEHLSRGRAVLIAPYDAKFNGIFECIHGGLLATLTDTAGGTALLTVMDPDIPLATTDMNIRFLAPCRTDARAEARVVKAGSSLVIAEINIHDMDGKHVALSHASYMLLTRK